MVLEDGSAAWDELTWAGMLFEINRNRVDFPLEDNNGSGPFYDPPRSRHRPKSPITPAKMKVNPSE